jgi:hypothetical protein
MLLRKKLICIAVIISNAFLSNAQILGCTDPFATNYNKNASKNDGSCLYPITRIPTTFRAAMSSAIPESSGLVYTNGKLWTHNDSGNPSTFFSIDTANGNTLQTVTVDNFPNTDWEDITADSNYIYLSDCGNNNGDRTDLKILKIAKSDIGSSASVHLNAQAISVAYSDQTVFTNSSTHNYDCESVISIGNTLYLFTKDRGDLQTRVYRVPKTPGTYTISPYTSYNVNGLICGADYDPIKKEVALVGYFKGHLNSFMWILNDFQNDSFFSGNKRRIEIGDGSEWQTEGICYRGTGKLFISCESAGQYANSSLFVTNKNEWEKTATSGIDNTAMVTSNEIYPNPASNSLHIQNNEPILSFSIQNLIGETIYSETINSKSFELDLSKFSHQPGMYLIKLVTEKYVSTNKVMLR